MTLAGQRSFTELGTPLSEVPFCVLDLETTGVAPDSCEITEIGALRFVGGEETGRFQTLVNPRSPIPPTVTVITGITQAMVVDAPTIDEVLPSFLEFLSDAVIVGHNVRFDISFLNAAALRLGYGRLPNRSADTMRLARRLLGSEVRRFSLSRLAAHMGSPITPNHRAFDDAHATSHVFWALLERAGTIGVTHLDDLLALPTIRGSRAIGKIGLTEHLPRTPGVYLFRDRAGEVVYVGKATNLRARVRSYFAGDDRRRTDDLMRDLERIDHIRTSCELEASVRELRLIADHRPRYNRRSQPPRSLHWVTLTDEAYPRLSITRIAGRGLLSLGPFRSRRHAESVMHAIWDASEIRRCSRPGRNCHYAQLGVARCPHADGFSDDEYADVVAYLLEGLRHDPASLVDAIRRRLESLSLHARFEEAAHCRDGWRRLAAALEHRRAWLALRRAGTVVACRDGILVEVHGARLVAAWPERSTRPLVEISEATGPHPASMVEADEAHLIWRWLSHPDTRLISVSGELATPPRRIPALDAIELPHPHDTTEPLGTSPSIDRSTTPSSVSTPRTRTSLRNPPTRS